MNSTNGINNFKTITKFAIGIFAVLFLGLLIIAIINRPAPPKPMTLEEEYSKNYVQSVASEEAQQADAFTKDSKVGDLIQKLPYQGKYFQMEFDYKKFEYIATINTKQKAAGDKELDDFLKQNGIESRSWFRNLTVTYK